MASRTDLIKAKGVLRGQLLQLGLGGNVIAARATISVQSAVRRASRNVHAVGIGKKISDGKASGPLCVRIYIIQKLPKSLLSPRDVIPKSIDGIPTDIVEAEPPFFLAPASRASKRTASRTARRKKPATASTFANCSPNRQKRLRPVVGGISAGHRDITAGTLGCFCRSTRTDDDPSVVMALSNNHVFADVNKALVGDPLYQQSPADGGGFNEHFADLERFVGIKLGGQQGNNVDAAVGTLLSGTAHNSKICMIGAITGTTQATEDMAVHKHGRTTGLTEGEVDDTDYDGLVGMDHNDPSVVGRFENQIRIKSTSHEPIGLGGDSGSIVLQKSTNKAVGLYFAGPSSGSYGLANKIEHVLRELEIELI